MNEKEIIRICEKFNKEDVLIFECKVDSHVLKIGEQCIINYLELHDYDWRLSTFQMKTLDGKKGFKVYSEELINLFELKEERYNMSNDQNAQIDCRITNCKFYKGSGTCSNISPALTLNENKTFVCWSKKII